MGRHPFANYPDDLILKRTVVEKDEKCATCGEAIRKGALADTRDHASYFCDCVCEKKHYLKTEGRAETIAAPIKSMGEAF